MGASQPTQPGWFPDPGNHEVLRWWDGTRWTDHVRSTQRPVPPQRPWFRQPWLWIVVGVLLVAGVVANAVGDENLSPTAASDTPPVGATSGAPQSSAQPSSPDSAAGTTLPDVVGMNLKQATSQLTDLRLNLTVETTDLIDSTRSVWAPSNWDVCTQDPSPGSVIARSETVMLGIAKSDENCGKPMDYTPPKDGKWPSYVDAIRGKVPLGKPVSLPNAGFSGWSLTVTVLEPPTITAENKLVSVSTSMRVKRTKGDGSSGNIDGSIAVSFVPGNIVPTEGDPLLDHASKATIVCKRGTLAVNQSTTCTTTVKVHPEEIPNFFWAIGPNSSHGAVAAAWPGQKG